MPACNPCCWPFYLCYFNLAFCFFDYQSKMVPLLVTPFRVRRKPLATFLVMVVAVIVVSISVPAAVAVVVVIIVIVPVTISILLSIPAIVPAVIPISIIVIAAAVPVIVLSCPIMVCHSYIGRRCLAILLPVVVSSLGWICHCNKAEYGHCGGKSGN